ncbi:MAG: Na/Pi cotransporter family protein [Aestuariibacter sp.]|jgi:sodium-dependent phosphate cotransporter|uniref:Na/Pi symporter n=1 Tax=Marisediminitalea aggregata TaxID=634436 RepID=UPI0020CBEEA3|nr:Na/Pi symporter [Marisediminitalea aggregata]MCP3863978.1 Na/Pi cotransporter family protein [Aestuariibacter sp.]MCP4526408.1 Na/Pi cotransporter family protein [Aestuariibacter sp.]MCP4947053.1 Na/Pi cotransporter family protein [Aestuariibacter sp.]MCP9478907.1 Na/Pi symporter [Marisediminitalea aggregata]
MTSPTLSPTVDITVAPQPQRSQWAVLCVLIYFMLLAVSIIGNGFNTMTSGHAEGLFEFASHPVTGLIIGILATALIQSSSTVTSIIVAMVAGGLPITLAVPMMMGANVGTSITNTIVSMGHIHDKREYEKAFQAATIHDVFNVMAVIIFLPLEILFGLLERISGWLVSWMHSDTAVAVGGFNPIKAVTKPVNEQLQWLLGDLSNGYAGAIMIVLGIGLIVASITFLGRIMKALMVGRAKSLLYKSIGRGPVSGIASGTAVTVLVQSSSTTTSLMVPLVGSGVLTARDIYPFTLGANIGTCITALIAALGITGVMAEPALQIALVHLVYNVLAVAVIFGLPWLREIPPVFSAALARQVAKRKILGVMYILGVFFALPFGLLLLSGFRL